jgi:hypothetical protein
MRFDERMREGRRRLKKRLGQARAMAKKEDTSFATKSKTLVAQSLIETVRERNLDALIVYEDGAGKWFGDLVLKGLPPGVPSILGTPTSMPRSSFEEAEQDAFHVLVGILASIEEQKTTKRDMPVDNKRVFELYNMDFKIDPRSVDKARELAAELVLNGLLPKDLSEDDLKQHLQASVEHLLVDDRIEEAAFENADDRTKALIYSAMSMLLNFGVFRFPDVKTSSPRWEPNKHDA